MKPDLVLCDTPARTFFNGRALFATAAAGDTRDGTTKDGAPRLAGHADGAAVETIEAAGKVLHGLDEHGHEFLVSEPLQSRFGIAGPQRQVAAVEHQPPSPWSLYGMYSAPAATLLYRSRLFGAAGLVW